MDRSLPPNDYARWADATFVALAKLTPQLPAMMGLALMPSFADVAGELNDYSLGGVKARSDALAIAKRQHDRFDKTRLSAADALSHAVFTFLLDYFPFDPWIGAAGSGFELHPYPVQHFDGAPSDLFGHLTRAHSIRSEHDADLYLQRISRLKYAVSDLREGLEYRDARGLSPPLNALTIMIRELHDLIAAGPSGCVLVVAFRSLLESATAIDSRVRTKLAEQAFGIVGELFLDGLPRLLARVERLAVRARTDIGIWALPDGDAYYRHCLTRQNTTQLPADAIFEIGREETARLRTELATAVSSIGTGDTDGRTVISRMNDREAPVTYDSEFERATILGYYQQLVDDVTCRIRPHFGRFPRRACLVIPTPPHLEAHRTSSYYPGSVIDGQPGTFELCMNREIGRPSWERHYLAYHEAVPGHHLQLSIAQELEGLPLFRRAFVVAGYIEGWAKYAERLPFETGIDPDPRCELHRISVELISAANLMLDVGIHHRRWNRQQAIAFMEENAMLDTSMSEYLVDRVTVSPAQATAYMIGLRCIRGLRDDARLAQGVNFNLANFHDAILGEGALPLDLLRSMTLERMKLTAEMQ